MRFRVILADPPWAFDDRLSMDVVARGAEAQYPVMRLDAICAMPVAKLALPDAILVLWCPASLLEDGLRVMDAWGFRQKQLWEWIKLRKDAQNPGDLAFGMGRLARNCSEIMLVGARGSPYRFLQSHSERNVFVGPADLSLVGFHPATPHSVKPEMIHDALERMFPDGPFLELFARRPKENWTCWGHDVSHRDIREDIQEHLHTIPEPDVNDESKTPTSPMQRPWVTHVRSSIKGGVDRELGPRTLIIGDHGEGKTAIVQAVELAGTSAASDVQGRPLVREAKLLADLAAPAPLQAEAALSSGATLMYGPKGDRIVFPLREVRESLLGGADTMRAWVLRLAAGAVTTQQVDAALADNADAVAFFRVTALAHAGASAADALRAALETARGKLSVANRDVTQAEGAVRFLQAAEGDVPTRQELEAAEAAVRDAAGVSVSGLKAAAERAAATFRTVRADLAVAKGDLEAKQQRVDELTAQIPEAWTDPAHQQRAEAAKILHAAACRLHDRAQSRGGESACVCGRVASQVAFAETIVAMAEASEIAARAQLAVDALSHARKEMQIADLRVSQLRDQVEPLRAQALAAVDAFEAAQHRPDAVAAANALARIRSALDARDKLMAARAQLAANQEQGKAWGETVRALEAAMEKVVQQATRELEARVQKYMPADEVFAIQLTPTSCRMGLRADFGIRTAICGAEWVHMVLALGAVVAESLPLETPVVLTPEERAWKPEALAETMRVLRAAPVQVLLTSPIEPSEVPDGWTVLRLQDAPPATKGQEKPKRASRKRKAATEDVPPTAGLGALGVLDLDLAAERAPLVLE